MLYRGWSEMLSGHATFDLGRIIITIFILLISAALINCNSAPLVYAYARILLAPKIIGSSNNSHSGPENSFKPFTEIHSGPIFHQHQVQLPQSNSSTGPSSLSLLSELPTQMPQLPTRLSSSASSSVTNQVLPSQQIPSFQQQQQQQQQIPSFQQQQQQIPSFQQQQQQQQPLPNYRSWFPSLPASSCPGTFQLNIDGLAYFNSLHYKKNGIHQISVQITSVYGNNTVAGKMWIDKQTDKEGGIDFLVKDTFNNCQVVTSNSTLH